MKTAKTQNLNQNDVRRHHHRGGSGVGDDDSNSSKTSTVCAYDNIFGISIFSSVVL